MDLIFQNRELAFSSCSGVPPSCESRHFFRFDIKFTVHKMPKKPEIHRHYYVSCELENQLLNIGGVGEDDRGWFVYQVLYENGMPYASIKDVASYKDGMSALISSNSVYYWMADIRNGFVGMEI